MMENSDMDTKIFLPQQISTTSSDENKGDTDQLHKANT